jgi:uroporphyrinogen decarboxylase
MTDERGPGRRVERLTELVRGGAPEQPLVFPMVVADHAARLEGFAVSEAVTQGDTLARVLYAAYRRYGYDLVLVFADTTVEAEAMGAQVIIPEDDNPFIIEAARVSRLEPARPDRDGRMPVVLDAARRLAKLLEGEAPVLVGIKGPFSLASFLRGMGEFLEDLLRDPGRARDYLSVALANQRRYADAIVAAGAVPFIGDPVASGSMISASMFREFALPYLRQLVDGIRDAGAAPFLHVCGDTRHTVGDMARSGAAVLSVDEGDLRVARSDAGPGVALMGNVSTRLMLEGTPEEVAAAARECRAAAGPRLVLSTSCDVPADTPPENVAALVRAGRGAA